MDDEVGSVIISRLAESRGCTRAAALRDLESGGVIDSLEGLELAIAAEKAFQITISDDELSSAVCRSIPALVALVNSKRAATEASGGEAAG